MHNQIKTSLNTRKDCHLYNNQEIPVTAKISHMLTLLLENIQCVDNIFRPPSLLCCYVSHIIKNVIFFADTTIV